MRPWAVIAVVVLALAAPVAAYADQNSPKLDALFRALAATDDPARAAPIERQIWAVWGLPDNREASVPFVQGVLLMNQGDLQGARARFDEVVKVAPDFAEGWNKRATVAYFLGDLQASVRDIERTIALEPRHFGALSGLAMIYTDIGKEEAALDALIQAKELYPGMPGIDERMQQLRETIAGKKI